MALRAAPRLLSSFPMGVDVTKQPGEGWRKATRPPSYQNIMDMKCYTEKGMPLIYPRWYEDSEEKIDHNYILFNRPQKHIEKIGLVVETTKKTCIVACRYFVRYRNFARVVARTQQCWAHDEDNACVVGDVVQIRKIIRRGKFKHFMIASILEPNIDGRERLRCGLAAMDPPAKPVKTTGFNPIFDLSRSEMVNEEEARRAEQDALDIAATDADYDAGLADRTGRDKWGYLDADFDESADPEAAPDADWGGMDDGAAMGSEPLDDDAAVGSGPPDDDVAGSSAADEPPGGAVN